MMPNARRNEKLAQFAPSVVPPHPNPHAPAHTLNAIARPLPAETDAEATARHLRTCHELAELGMNLARAAARETERALVAPVEYPMPGAALEPLCRTADPGLLFTRLAHAVRQTIALETRIRADRWQATARDRATPKRETTPPAQTARPDALTRPRATFRPEPAECDADEFTPDRLRPAQAVIADIRRDLNLPPDAKTVRRAQLKRAAELNIPPMSAQDRRSDAHIPAYPPRRPDG